jgi:biotin synthase
MTVALVPPPADSLADLSLAGEPLTPAQARAVLDWPEEGLLDLVAAGHRVRRRHFGRRVKLNFLVNIQSGLCPEDCSYCSQSKVSTAPIAKYRLLSPTAIVAEAERAARTGAARLCLVASMRGPSDRDLSAVTAAVRAVKKTHPHLEVCACLGLLKDGQAEALRRAGVDAYNHNLNTSEKHYGEICSTHTFADRVDTVGRAQSAGMSACSGALFGMGETDADVVEVAFRLREMKVSSIPVNFLIPVPGTPLADRQELTPRKCLKILCLFRFLNPATELRIAGGRELHLRSLQPLGLLVANSVFIGDYLTTQGQAAAQDIAMIEDLGFEIEGDRPAGTAPARRMSDEVVFTAHAL